MSLLTVALAAFIIEACAEPALSQKPPAPTPNTPSSQTPAPSADPNFTPPRAIPSSVMKNWPVYTMEARRAHRVGIVLLSVKISEDGTASDVKVERTSKFTDLDAAAVAAVRNWKFTPAMREGKPTEITVSLPVNFSLKTAEKPAEPEAQKKPVTPPKPKPKTAAKTPPKPATLKPVAVKPDAPAPGTGAPAAPASPQ